MELDLIDGRQRLRLPLQAFQVLDPEVGDADRAGSALLMDPLEGAPGIEEAILGRDRPVDQVEVEAIQPEAVEALLESSQGRLVALLGVPQLGRDEDLVAGDVGGSDRRSHAALVAVRGGGIDVTVTRLQRLLDNPPGIVGGPLEDAEAELWDLDSVMNGHP